MEVILREDIDKLGTRGELVKVTPGYARNFLLPQRMAVAATNRTKRSSSRSGRRISARKPRCRREAADLAKLMARWN